MQTSPIVNQGLLIITNSTPPGNMGERFQDGFRRMTRRLRGSFHSIVIGAGPGGLACATTLARHGKEVLVLERRQEVGPKVCAGGVTWSGLCRRLPAGIMERSFHSQHVFSPAQRLVIRSPAPIISTVDRLQMGQWMLSEALAAGVNIETGVRALAVRENLVETSAGLFAFRYLVGADGSSSLVRRSLGLDCEQVGVGIHYLVPGFFEKMEWHMDQRLFHNGYAWIFPRNDLASVGVYAVRPGFPRKNLHESLKKWARQREIDLSKGRFEAALINFDYRGWRFGNIFLVGDAAGLASGLTGEGIYPAIISGETVAATIIDSRFKPLKLERLIRKLQRHQRLLRLMGNSLSCRLGIEAFMLGLRTRLVGFNALEMGD